MSATAPQKLEVRKQLEFVAPPDRVWEAITNPAQIAKWFPDGIEVEEFAPGKRGWFQWEKHGRYAFEVETMERPHHLVWSWAREPNTEFDDAPSTRVEWKLEAQPGGGTRLLLVETGFATDQKRGENDSGWDHELGELVEYLQV